MKAFNESQQKRFAGPGLILLFDGEVGTALSGAMTSTDKPVS